MDIFTDRNISPMLIANINEAFDSSDYTFEVKWDGIRGIVYLNGENTDIRNKRNKLMLPILPELAGLHKQVKQNCILDGELVVLKNSHPDFYEMQKRALLTNLNKIELASSRNPVTFIAYDILYYNNMDIMHYPLIERKKYLDDIINENEKIVISRYIETYGIKLYELVEENKLEGMVAKKKSSLYWPGKKSKDWIKCKRMVSEDFIVCGYIVKTGGTSLILGQYKNDEQLIYRGNVTLGVTLKKIVQERVNKIEKPAFGFVPKGYDEAIWLEPQLVCIVESMATEGTSFRQPVFKGFRNDKEAKDCKIKKIDNNING